MRQSASLLHVTACLLGLSVLTPAHARLPDLNEFSIKPVRLAQVLNYEALRKPVRLPTCASLDADAMDLRLEVVNTVYAPENHDRDNLRRRAFAVPLTSLVYVLEDAGEGGMVPDFAVRVASLIDRKRAGCRK